jgi:hypothetical protein
MSVTHSTAARNAATDAVTALIGASGKLAFRTTGTVGAPGTVCATLSLSATAFGASATGTATANAITSDTAAAGGTVATATLQTSAGTVVIHCAVAASASDINMTGGLVVAALDTVACSALTYTALPA